MPRVLIATDGSDFSITSARRALELLKPDLSVTVLTVVTVPVGGTIVPGPEGAGFAPAPVATEEIEQAATREAEANLDRTIEALAIDAEKAITRGDPRAEIVRVAEDGDYDLIVLGSHGWGLLHRVLMGSVSHHVLHHAPCPVLLIRAANDED